MIWLSGATSQWWPHASTWAYSSVKMSVMHRFYTVLRTSNSTSAFRESSFEKSADGKAGPVLGFRVSTKYNSAGATSWSRTAPTLRNSALCTVHIAPVRRMPDAGCRISKLLCWIQYGHSNSTRYLYNCTWHQLSCTNLLCPVRRTRTIFNSKYSYHL